MSMVSTTCRLGWIFEVIFAASQYLEAPWYVRSQKSRRIDEDDFTNSLLAVTVESLQCYVINVS